MSESWLADLTVVTLASDDTYGEDEEDEEFLMMVKTSLKKFLMMVKISLKKFLMMVRTSLYYLV